MHFFPIVMLHVIFFPQFKLNRFSLLISPPSICSSVANTYHLSSLRLFYRQSNKWVESTQASVPTTWNLLSDPCRIDLIVLDNSKVDTNVARGALSMWVAVGSV